MGRSADGSSEGTTASGEEGAAPYTDDLAYLTYLMNYSTEGFKSVATAYVSDSAAAPTVDAQTPLKPKRNSFLLPNSAVGLQTIGDYDFEFFDTLPGEPPSPAAKPARATRKPQVVPSPQPAPPPPAAAAAAAPTAVTPPPPQPSPAKRNPRPSSRQRQTPDSTVAAAARTQPEPKVKVATEEPQPALERKTRMERPSSRASASSARTPRPRSRPPSAAVPVLTAHELSATRRQRKGARSSLLSSAGSFLLGTRSESTSRPVSPVTVERQVARPAVRVHQTRELKSFPPPTDIARGSTAAPRRPSSALGGSVRSLTLTDRGDSSRHPSSAPARPGDRMPLLSAVTVSGASLRRSKPRSPAVVSEGAPPVGLPPIAGAQPRPAARAHPLSSTIVQVPAREPAVDRPASSARRKTPLLTRTVSSDDEAAGALVQPVPPPSRVTEITAPRPRVTAVAPTPAAVPPPRRRQESSLFALPASVMTLDKSSAAPHAVNTTDPIHLETSVQSDSVLLSASPVERRTTNHSEVVPASWQEILPLLQDNGDNASDDDDDDQSSVSGFRSFASTSSSDNSEVPALDTVVVNVAESTYVRSSLFSGPAAQVRQSAPTAVPVSSPTHRRGRRATISFVDTEHKDTFRGNKEVVAAQQRELHRRRRH